MSSYSINDRVRIANLPNAPVMMVTFVLDPDDPIAEDYNIEEQGVHCLWFSSDGQPHKRVFPSEILERAVNGS